MIEKSLLTSLCQREGLPVLPLFFASANQPGLRKRGARGDFLINVYSIMNTLIILC
jgi:hypothetical protein